MSNDPSEKIRQLGGALPPAARDTPGASVQGSDMARGHVEKDYVKTPPTHDAHEQQSIGRGHAVGTVVNRQTVRAAPGANPLDPVALPKNSQPLVTHPGMARSRFEKDARGNETGQEIARAHADTADHDCEASAVLGRAVKSGSTELG
jgi:hypothetical protein